MSVAKHHIAFARVTHQHISALLEIVHASRIHKKRETGETITNGNHIAWDNHFRFRDGHIVC